jgi:excisionase family DNA binding protein
VFSLDYHELVETRLTPTRPAQSAEREEPVLTQEATEYLTIDEAAVRAHVSSVTMRRAVKSGTLIYRAMRGKTKLLSAKEVDEWVRARTEIREIEPKAEE